MKEYRVEYQITHREKSEEFNDLGKAWDFAEEISQESEYNVVLIETSREKVMEVWEK